MDYKIIPIDDEFVLAQVGAPIRQGYWYYDQELTALLKWQDKELHNEDYKECTKPNNCVRIIAVSKVDLKPFFKIHLPLLYNHNDDIREMYKEREVLDAFQSSYLGEIFPTKMEFNMKYNAFKRGYRAIKQKYTSTDLFKAIELGNQINTEVTKHNTANDVWKARVDKTQTFVRSLDLLPIKFCTIEEDQMDDEFGSLPKFTDDRITITEIL